MKQADVLFFGELHNDSIAHLLQASLLDSLIKSYKNVALSLEALSDDYEVILNEYLKGFYMKAVLRNWLMSGYLIIIATKP